MVYVAGDVLGVHVHIIFYLLTDATAWLSTLYLLSQVAGEYSVLFEDTSYPEGYSPALDVPQRYVLPMRETKKK